MPTLPSIDFGFTSQAGERLAWRSTVSVDSEGVFHCTFPEELVQVAKVELRAFKKSPFDPLTITQPRTHWQVQGPNLDECKTFLRRVAEAYLRTETTVERLIVYHMEPMVRYYRLGDGTIRPHGGGLSEEESRAGSWHGTRMHNASGNHYKLGLYAQVLDRVTERRGDHIAVRYERPQLPKDSWGDQLNSWNHLENVPTFLPHEQPWPHVLYTEAGAQFFYQMLLRLCTIADQLTTFFSDPAMLTKALTRTELFPMLPPILPS